MAHPTVCTECHGKIAITMFRPYKMRRRLGKGPGEKRTAKGHDLCAKCWQALLDRGRREGRR